MAGLLKPSKVSVYMKLNTLLVTSGLQFGFGHVKVAKNWSVLVPGVDCAGTASRPFFVEVIVDEVFCVMDFENGSTILLFTPGL